MDILKIKTALAYIAMIIAGVNAFIGASVKWLVAVYWLTVTAYWISSTAEAIASKERGLK